MPKIDALFEQMVAVEASDLHLTTGENPKFRLHGDIVDVPGAEPFDAEAMRALLYEITPQDNRTQYEECCDTDFAYELPGQGRFRANLFMDRKGPGAVFRLIPSEVLTAEQLDLPKAVLDLCYLSKGLVVVTGPTGSGKSTTLAAMIDHVNKNRSDHIITIEDPVEFVHRDQRCLINQREVHKHTDSFKKALRAALREDPDILLVGEMRDLETIEIAIETAETGHLVFGTLHTTTAPSTIDRIIDQFPADRQSQIRTMLSGSLKGVIAQTLCKKKPKGRVAALEIMIGNTAVASNIREGKTHQIPSAMQMGGKVGMRMLNDSLLELVKNDLVDPREAYVKAVNKDDMLNKLSSIGINVDMSQPSTPEPAAPAAPAAAPAAKSVPLQTKAPAASPPVQSAPGLFEPQPQAPIPQAAPQPQPEPAPEQQGGGGYVDPFEQFRKKR